MKAIERIDAFPFRIRQETVDWCIPANIEAVTKYYEPASYVTQGYLVTQFGDMTKIGFKSIKEKVLDVDSHFAWATAAYFGDSDFNKSFGKFAEFVHKCVDDSTPPMISIPVGEKSWHIVTVVGYDASSFLIYNPDPRMIHGFGALDNSSLQTDLCSAKKTEDGKKPVDAATDSLVLSRKKPEPVSTATRS